MRLFEIFVFLNDNRRGDFGRIMCFEFTLQRVFFERKHSEA
jgi:hypothetical protein